MLYSVVSPRLFTTSVLFVLIQPCHKVCGRSLVRHGQFQANYWPELQTSCLWLLPVYIQQGSAYRGLSQVTLVNKVLLEWRRCPFTSVSSLAAVVVGGSACSRPCDMGEKLLPGSFQTYSLTFDKSPCYVSAQTFQNRKMFQRWVTDSDFTS